MIKVCQMPMHESVKMSHEVLATPFDTVHQRSIDFQAGH